MDWISDTDTKNRAAEASSDDDFQWDSDDADDSGGAASTANEASCVSPPAPRCHVDGNGASCRTESSITAPPFRRGSNDNEAGPSRPDLMSHFMDMGFSEDMIAKAIKNNEDGDSEAILETLLTCSAIEKSPSDKECSPEDCSFSSEEDILDEDYFDMDGFSNEDFTPDSQKKDRILSTLVDMGFHPEEASSAIDRCGPDASVLELADSIRAAQMAEEYHLEGPPITTAQNELRRGYAYDPSRDKRRRFAGENFHNKRGRFQNQSKECIRRNPIDFDAPLFTIPNPMIGFSLPNERTRMISRKLPDLALGPPYFYYENVALAPKGAWETISRFLFDIVPEFVDSKYFCAAARKRGYIHNLPIENRVPLLPLPPKTIQEALPLTKKWWPSWDTRTQLNCLQTCTASSRLTDRIRSALASSDDPPPSQVQQYVLNECRKWNLVWVGRHKLAPLEPDEIEMLLGFPRDHTRGGGISRTERYRSLGNSFQVDTVAYHLSVLRGMFPDGLTVLSLFTGIGGAEVALHRLGIRLKTVVSVELSEINRNILRGWWEQTGQTGTLIEIADVQQLNGDRLEQLITTYEGFDLVVGGSPCNNLSGSNRYSRDGLEGKQSSLFFDYIRILDLVKCLMKGNNI